MKKINKKTVRLIESGSEEEAADALDALLKDRTVWVALTYLANDLMKIGRFSLAAKIYAKWAELEPKNPMAWSNLGASLAKLRLIKEAKDILLHALELDPNFKQARINLSGVLQELELKKEQLENALETVKLDPKSALAFSNLGVALNDNGFLGESRHAFETALMLDPSLSTAKFNIAKVASRMGDYQAAIQGLEELLAAEEKNGGAEIDLFRYNLAEDYLKTGRLEEGWGAYDLGFSEKIPLLIARHPLRRFTVPLWDGQHLAEHERLMVWREQGIGDEVMFGTLLPKLKGLGGRVILECEDRLTTLFARTFPEFEVRRQCFDPSQRNFQTRTDYDFHVPIGSLSGHFLSNTADFSKTNSYLKLDENKVSEFKSRLSTFGNKKLIGICWRSGLLSINRNQDYTVIDDWVEILSNPDVTFVNLQYGECEEELQSIERKLNINIVRWKDVDLKNDIESVCAIIKNLDLVVSVGTAVAQFSGAVGTPTVLMTRFDWPLLGQRDVYPWFPSVTPLVVERTDFVAKALPVVPELIKKNLFVDQ